VSPNNLHQVDPSRPYAYYRFLRDDDPVPLAELIAVAEDSQGFKAGQEYWRLKPDVTSIDTYEARNIYITKTVGNPANPPPFKPDEADFVCSLTPRWTDVRSNASVACHHYDDSFGPCGFRLKVDRPDTRSAWTGTISWIRPKERFVPLFRSKDDYHLTKVTLDQGQTVVNLIGTYWTDPVTGYGDGDWRAPVVLAQPATGLQVIYGGDKFGIINLRMVNADGTFSAWASDDMSGDSDPPDDKANLRSPVLQVSVRTGYYLNYSLGLVNLAVNLDAGGTWVTPFGANKNTNDLTINLPARCAVVGIQGKKRADYGLVDLKLAYRELP
jgi:hypothetical protein